MTSSVMPRAAVEAPPVLEVRGLTVDFATESGRLSAVDHVDLTLGEGEIVGIVGESGCGKSVTAMSLAGLLPGQCAYGRFRAAAGRRAAGSERRRAARRPRTRHRVHLPGADELAEPRPHRRAPDLRGPPGAREALAPGRPREVGGPPRPGRHPVAPRAGPQLPAPALGRYAATRDDRDGDRLLPKVLIADEPTTALDVTVQAGILDVLRGLRDRLGTSILIITHDLGVIADIADRVVVMYAGRVVERARVGRAVRPSPAPLHGRAVVGLADLGSPRRHAPAAGDPGAGPRPQRPAGRLHLRGEMPRRVGAVPVEGTAAGAGARPDDGPRPAGARRRVLAPPRRCAVADRRHR